MVKTNLGNRKGCVNRDMEYVVIVGGGVANKGAQSMTFQIIKEIRKHMPGKEVVVFCNSKTNDVPKMDLEYNVKVVPFDAKDILYFTGGIKKVASVLLGEKKERIKEIQEILDNACLAFDISGYSFSSEWSALNSVKYLYRIQIMKKKKIPMIIMPQSFGPFHYAKFWKIYIKRLASGLLKYPMAIYAREEESYKELTSQYKLDNLYLSVDMVLLGGEVNRDEIYKEKIQPKHFEILENSVGIIPNKKVLEHSKEEEIINLYKGIIDRLLQIGRNIYIVQHSTPDQEFCKKLKEIYKNHKKVYLIEDELDCLDYDELVAQFDYVVASRYHSIVHAYKRHIPCIAVGWSYKYQVLLKHFSQLDYLIDVKNLQEECAVKCVDEMQEKYKQEKEVIQSEMDTLRKEKFYDELFKLIG